MIFTPANYDISTGSHNGTDVIWIRFPYDATKIATIHSIGAKWSQSQKAWYLKDTSQARITTGLPTPSIGKNALARITGVNIPAYQRMEEELTLKAYSPSTVRTYCTEFAQLLYILRDVPVDSLKPDRLRSYLLYCHKELKLSENSLHSRINAIKFYFEQVLHQEKFFADIPRPKKPSLLPKVLSTGDVKKLFNAVSNLKHRLMLQLCYGMGLRVSEIVALQITHIDSGRMQVLISGAKGKKDRYVNLPEAVLTELRAYYKLHKPEIYLFEGQNGGAYSIRSVQAVFKNTMLKAKINKQIGIHGLRHSYATHLHEYGTDITLIQKLLGHNDLKTTLLYTHVSQQSLGKIKSPLDKLL